MLHLTTIDLKKEKIETLAIPVAGGKSPGKSFGFHNQKPLKIDLFQSIGRSQPGRAGTNNDDAARIFHLSLELP